MSKNIGIGTLGQAFQARVPSRRLLDIAGVGVPLRPDSLASKINELSGRGALMKAKWLP